jgi:PKD repeat protein
LFGDEKYEEYFTWKPYTSHVYTEPGIYEIKLIVEGIVNSMPVQDSITKIIKIMAAPVAQFTVQNLCIGDTVHLTDHSYSLTDTITQWRWWFGDGEHKLTKSK